MEFRFKTKPLSHQLKYFESQRDDVTDAVFWEMGTGKTKFTLDQVVWHYVAGRIDALLVVAPSGVHRNWVSDEIPIHLPEEIHINTAVWQSGARKTKRHQQMIHDAVTSPGLAVFAMNYEAFTTQAGKDAAWKFLKNRKVFMVLDESPRIKSPGAKRTRSIIAAGKYAKYRRILTGTAISNGPFDAYSQFRFLNEDFWKPLGMHRFESFKARYGIWKAVELSDGRSFTTCVAYRFLDELQEIIDENSTRVLKKDVLDLPDKVYQKRYVALEPEQARLYKQLKDESLLFFQHQGEDVFIDAGLAIVKLLRLQQVICGYLPTEDGEPVELVAMKKDGRVNAVLDLLRESGEQKTIIWARFRMDIERLARAVRDAGFKAVTYYGATTTAQRAEALDSFRGENVQVFIANPATAGEGLTLTEAKNVIYFSNSFKLAERLQSEDRAHRIGQKNNVLYTDIVCEDTVDEKIVESLRGKQEIALHLMSDPIKEWI